MRVILLILLPFLLFQSSLSAQTTTTYNDGGTDYTVVSYTSTGTTTWTAPAGVTSVDVLIVAGGGGAGGGGNNSGCCGGGGGGGSAGQVQFISTVAVTPGNGYSITVGAGGTGEGGGSNSGAWNGYNGTNGGSSSGFGYTSTGGNGGWGAGRNNELATSWVDGAGGYAHASGNGYAGGNRYTTGSGGAGGGGGGGGGAGASATGTGSGGAGGIAVSNDITGTALDYGLGGAGGNGSSNNTAGASGTDGRGNGGQGGGGVTNGTAKYGGDGGDGIVIIRYESPVLPVEWLSFEATPSLTGIELIWNTASETSSKAFTIERSQSIGDWQEIGSLPAAGYSSLPLAYSFFDPFPSPGKNTYRIRQTDFNGSSYLSHSVTAVFETIPVTIHPNPTSDWIYIDQTLATPTECAVVDLQGRVVFSTLFATEHKAVDLSFLPTGLFLLTLTDEFGISSHHRILRK